MSPSIWARLSFTSIDEKEPAERLQAGKWVPLAEILDRS